MGRPKRPHLRTSKRGVVFNAGRGPRSLPTITYKGKTYTFDYRLSELRDGKTLEAIPLRRSESDLFAFALGRMGRDRQKFIRLNMADLEEQSRLGQKQPSETIQMPPDFMAGYNYGIKEFKRRRNKGDKAEDIFEDLEDDVRGVHAGEEMWGRGLNGALYHLKDENPFEFSTLPSGEKWFHPKRSLHGWRKDMPANERRKHAIVSRSPLSAARALMALANVTKDAGTARAARDDAMFFYRMNRSVG